MYTAGVPTRSWNNIHTDTDTDTDTDTVTDTDTDTDTNTDTDTDNISNNYTHAVIRKVLSAKDIDMSWTFTRLIWGILKCI